MQNGDICEILVNKSSGRPSLDWLSLVKTSSAKHKIKQWFRKESREENVLLGQEALEQELVRAGLRTDVARGALLEQIAARLNYATPTDLYAAIGFGDASAQAVANRVRDELKHNNVVDLTKIGRKPAVRKSPRRSTGVRIAGVDDVLVRLSKCCSPVPGDPIIGYVTIGRGVSVHRADCPNVAYMNATPERILQAQWIDDAGLTHGVDVEVEAEDRSQLLQDIMAVFAELKTQVSSVNARVRKDGVAVTSLTVQIRDLDHLHKLLRKLEALRNVRRVYRVTKRERTAL
jgi:GTP pyrophosphokinase